MRWSARSLHPIRWRGGEKMGERPRGVRLRLSWPEAVRAVRAWLEPWTLLRRWWQAGSDLPPPPAVRALLAWLWEGHPLDCYAR